MLREKLPDAALHKVRVRTCEPVSCSETRCAPWVPHSSSPSVADTGDCSHHSTPAGTGSKGKEPEVKVRNRK